MKLVLPWKLHPYGLNFIMLEGAIYATKTNNKQTTPTPPKPSLTPAVNPSKLHKYCPGKIDMPTATIQASMTRLKAYKTEPLFDIIIEPKICG